MPLLEQHDVHGHLPQAGLAAHGVQHHPGVSHIKRRGAQQAQGKAPGIAAHRQLAVFGVQAPGVVAVALEEQRRQAEQLDLFGVGLMGQQRFQVILLTGLRRTPVEQAKRIAREMRLGEENR